MGCIIVNKEITDIQADVIINASNGIGYMGGIISRFIKVKGVAEAINYVTKGEVEKAAQKVCKRKKYLPRYFCAFKPGEIFITSAANLQSKYIIHAVTMRFPGMVSNINVIEKLLPKIITKAYELNAKSLAIPLLGCGTGKVSKKEVLNLYEKYFNNIKNLEIIISCI